MDTLIQDVRYAARMLARAPGFAAAAAIALALGIGANTTIFSVLDSLLLRALPYDHPESLVLVWSAERGGEQRGQMSFPDIDDVRQQNQVFEEVAAFADWSPILSGSGDPERLHATQVGDGYFRVLHASVMLGRTFIPEEQIDGRDQVVVLSHGLWQRRFGGDPNIVGKTITLSTLSYVVIGVMPESFGPLPRTLVQDGDLYRPVAETRAEARSGRHLRAIARLKPGVTMQQAQAEMSTIAANLAKQYPQDDRDLAVRLANLRDDTVGDLRPTAFALAAAVALVLLIACANVANLLLARASTRQREMAVRAAVGATRARLVRQMLTESLLLALIGGGAGLLLAAWAMSGLNSIAAKVAPQMGGVQVDARVLLFALLVCVATGIAFGAAPALQVSTHALYDRLRQGGHGAGAVRGRLRPALVVVEISMALLLLISAGLLIKSFVRLLNVDPGFDPQNRVMMNVWLPFAKYKDPNLSTAFYRQLVQRVEALPGVQAAGMVSTPPLTSFDRRGFRVEGKEYAVGQSEDADAYFVTPHYLTAMGTPLLRGRNFTESDDEKAPNVVMINQAAAAQLWPGQDAIGKHVKLFSGRKRDEYPTATVVGIVGDVKHYGLDRATTMQMYVPYAQFPTTAMSLVVHTAGDPRGVVPAVRRELLALDRGVPAFQIESMRELVANSVATRRLAMLVIGLLAAVALALSTVGIYAVMAYTVAQRTNEIGIRMALGARAADVLRMVLGEGTRLAAVGVGVGLALALAATHALRSLLFGVGPNDPLVFAALTALVVGVALVASYVPARRAARVDPMVALRNE
jgi:putative ABC transport system permease protein